MPIQCIGVGLKSLLPTKLRGPVAFAFFGGWSSPRLLHTPCPAALVDISGAFGWSYVQQGLQRFDAAERWTSRRVTGEIRALAKPDGLRERILANQYLFDDRLILVRLRPHGREILPTKAWRDGRTRLAMASTDFHGGSGWWYLSDVLAGVALGGDFPCDIVRAIEIMAHGVRSTLTPVRLASGRLVDPRDECLIGAIQEDRAELARDRTRPQWQRENFAGQDRMLSTVLSYGNRSRIDRTSLRRAETDTVVIDDELLTISTKHPEVPGPHFELAVAGAVTSRIRLVLAQVIGGLHELGGEWLHVATDSVLVAMTHDDSPLFVPCRGGLVRCGRQRGIFAFPKATVDEILQRTGAPWKWQAGSETPMTGYVSGTYRTAMLDLATGEGVATEAMLGGIYFDPLGTNARTTEGHFKWAVEAHLAVARSGIAWDGKGPVPDLDLPSWADTLAVRVGVARSPEQLTRLQRAYPDLVMRPYTPFGLAVVNPIYSHDVAPVTLDVTIDPSKWLDAEWRNLRTGGLLQLALQSSNAVGAIRCRSIREVMETWRIPTDPTLQPNEPSDHVIQSGFHHAVPVLSRPELFEPTGKEGDDLSTLMIDPLAESGDEITVYRRADTWSEHQRWAVQIGGNELHIRTGISERTCRNIAAGKRTTSEHMALVAAAHIKDPKVPYRTCRRAGCGSPIRRKQVYCSDACRKAFDRARDTIHLHRRGAWRCGRCGAVTYGERRQFCTDCRGRRFVKVTTYVCPGCGIERIKNTEGPCPNCEKEQQNETR